METEAAPALAMIIGTRNGETLRSPFSTRTRTWDSSVYRPPMPVAIMTPRRIGVGRGLTAVGQRQAGRGPGELLHPVGAPDLLGAVEPRLRVEVGDHEMVALGYGLLQARPERLLADAARGHHADAGDDDPTAVLPLHQSLEVTSS